MAVALVYCGHEGPVEPSAPSPFLVVHLTPSEGSLTWDLLPDGSVRLAPLLSWEAQFLAPTPYANTPPGNMRNLYVVVALLNEDQTAACFESATVIREVRNGLAYVAGATAFSLSSEALRSPTRPRENPCGSDFTVGAVEVSLRESRGGGAMQTRRFPCSYRFSRAASLP